MPTHITYSCNIHESYIQSTLKIVLQTVCLNNSNYKSIIQATLRIMYKCANNRHYTTNIQGCPFNQSTTMLIHTNFEPYKTVQKQIQPFNKHTMATTITPIKNKLKKCLTQHVNKIEETTFS